jgi:hypothetical protein
MLFSISVSDEVYNDIEARISFFRDGGKKYGFSHLGMFLAILRIPLKLPLVYHNSYFCTMFVSELIVKSGAAKLKYKPFRYLPRHFSNEPGFELCFEGVWGQPPEFSEEGGNLYTIPVRYVKRYAVKAHRRVRIRVKAARRDAYRRVRVARGKMIYVRRQVFDAPGKIGVICRDNLYTGYKMSREAIEKWWYS